MKRYLDFMIVAALFVTSCAKEEQTENLVKAPSIFASQENNPNTKTLLAVNEGVGTIYWQPAEDINVFFGTTSVKYTSTNTENVTTAAFETSTIIGSSEGSSTNIWGLYPYSSEAVCNGSKVTTTIPSTQYGVPDTFDKNLFTTLAHSTTKELQFLNVCGGIKFSLSRADITKITFEGNNGETLAGKVDLTFADDFPAATPVTAATKITLTPKTGSTFAKDVNYYIITLPVSMAGGFTMTFETATQIGTFNYTAKTVTVSRSKFSKKEHIDTYATYTDSPAENISETGTANCYLIDKAGRYKFKAVKGNSQVSVGDIKGVKVLWESFGTNVVPSVGSLLSPNVTYCNDYVYFSTNDSFRCGNAVIAAYSNELCTEGNVLWSWHIWLTEKPGEHVYYNNAGTVMDRNLGAYSTTMGDVRALGLLYQWGRKDPFLGSSSINNSTKANSTLSWPDPETVTDHIEGNTTLRFSIAHPTTFLVNSDSPYDWYCTSIENQDNTLWTSDKTIYDPCPAGWKTPEGGNYGLWSLSFGTTHRIEDGPWDDKYKGMNFGSSKARLGNYSTIWYPATGFLSSESSSLDNVGSDSYYWSNSTRDNEAFDLEIDDDGDIDPTCYDRRAYGNPVRCVKDESFVPTVITDLSKNGTANCYIVSDAGKYKFKTVQGNTNTSVGDVKGVKVLWESFGTDVAPSVGDLINSDVSYDDGYIIFNTNDTYKEGNAVIAAYSDASCTDGNVLWSWHIWMTDQPAEQVYYNHAGTMMDRNLGATSATPGDVHALGLMYFWGRKDPFLGGSKNSFPSYGFQEVATSTTVWPDIVCSNNTYGTIEFSLSHPMTAIERSSYNYDWYYTGNASSDITRWQENKTKYDPCPIGWRVPSGGANGIWAKTGLTIIISSDVPYDDVNKGMNFGTGNGKAASTQLGEATTIWYPFTGERVATNYDDAKVSYVGYNAKYWSCTPYGNSSWQSANSYLLGLGMSNVSPNSYNLHSDAHSVRCQKNQ